MYRAIIIVFCVKIVLFCIGDAVPFTASTPAGPNCCSSKGSAPYWSNPPFLIFDIPERPNVKIKNGGVRPVSQCVLKGIGGERVNRSNTL